MERFLVQPVIGIHHLVIDPGGVAQALVDPFAVAAVLLVDDLNDIGVLRGVAVADGGGVILGGAVVHQDDLNVAAAGQQGADTLVHVVGGVVAGNGKGDELLGHVGHLSLSISVLGRAETVRQLLLGKALENTKFFQF